MESLSNEILFVIAELLDKESMVALHSTSSQLYAGTDHVFAKRIFRTAKIDVSLRGLGRLSLLAKMGRLRYVEHLMISTQHVMAPVKRPSQDRRERSKIRAHEEGTYNGYLLPTRQVDNLQRVQQDPRYIRELNEQEELLRSGKFVSELAAGLSMLPNCTQLEIGDEPAFRVPAFRIKKTAKEDKFRLNPRRFIFPKPPALRTEDTRLDSRFRIRSLGGPGAHSFSASLITLAIAAVEQSKSTAVTELQIRAHGLRGFSAADLPTAKQGLGVVRKITSLDFWMTDYVLGSPSGGPCLVDFLRHFVVISALKIETDERDTEPKIESAMSYEPLTTVWLKSVSFLSSELLDFMDSDPWHSLQRLVLEKVSITEILFYIQSLSALPRDQEVWRRFFVWLESRPNLVSLEIIDCSLGGKSMKFPSYEPSGETTRCVLGREAGESWEGKLALTAEVITFW